MAATLDLGALGFSLLLDKSGWNKSWNETDKDLNTNSSKLKNFASGIGTTLKVGVAAAAAAAGTAIIAMAKTGIEQAVDLEKQMSKFKAATGATGEEAEKVKDIVKDLYKVNEDSYEDLAATAEALYTQMGMNAEGVEKYAQSYLDYAKVTGQADADTVESIAKVGKAWNLTADENVSLMDKLLVAQQKYGLSVTDSQAKLVNLAPSLQALGMDVDDAVGYLAMFNQAGVDSSTVTTAFTKALTKVKSPEELKQLITDIQNTEDPLERAQKASELFGTKAGPQMAQALADGTTSVDDFITSMNNAEGAVSNASAAYDDNFETRLALLKKKFSGMATEIGEKLLPIAEKLMGWVEDHMPEIEAAVTTVFDAIGKAIEWFSVNAMPALEAAFQAIWDIVQAVWPFIEAIVTGVINNITGIIKIFAALLKGDFSGAWQAVKDFVAGYIEGIKNILTAAWDFIKNLFGGAIEAVGTVLSNGWESIKNVAANAWEAITTTVSNAWEGIKNGISSAWEGIKGACSSAAESIKSGLSTAWENIKSSASNTWQTISTKASEIWGGVKDTITGVWDKLDSVTGGALGKMKDNISTAWSGVRDGTTSVWDAIKTTVTSVTDTISSIVSNAFGKIKETATNIWNGIKSAIETPIEAAKNFVKNIIDKIKEFFASISFKLPEFKWPSIKLPHFSITGSFSLSPLSIPKLTIDWYSQGAIFAKPTIFPTAQGLKGVGDVPGGEVVAPLSTLREYIQDALQDALPTSGALTITLEVDGLSIAKAELPYMDMLLSGEVNKRLRGVVNDL